MSEGAGPPRLPFQEEPLHSTEPSTSVPGAAVFTALPQPVPSGSTLDTPVGINPTAAVGVFDPRSRPSAATNSSRSTIAADASAPSRPLATAPPDPAALLRDVDSVRHLLSVGYPARTHLPADVPVIVLLLGRGVAFETIAETVAQRIFDEISSAIFIQQFSAASAVVEQHLDAQLADAVDAAVAAARPLPPPAPTAPTREEISREMSEALATPSAPHPPTDQPPQTIPPPLFELLEEGSGAAPALLPGASLSGPAPGARAHDDQPE